MTRFDSLILKLTYCSQHTTQKDIQKEPKYSGFVIVGNGEQRYFASLLQLADEMGYTISQVRKARENTSSLVTNDGYTIYQVNKDWSFS